MDNEPIGNSGAKAVAINLNRCTLINGLML